CGLKRVPAQYWPGVPRPRPTSLSNNGHKHMWRWLLSSVLCLMAASPALAEGLSIDWDQNYLTIRGDFAGGEVSILYLEAYCRAGSTDRDWHETVIPHKAELVSRSDDGRVIRLRDKL